MALLLYLTGTLLALGIGYVITVRRHFDVVSFYFLASAFLFVIPPVLIGMGLDSSVPNGFLHAINYDEALMMQGLIIAVYHLGLIFGYVGFSKTGLGRSLLPHFGDRRSDIMTFLGLFVITAVNFVIILGPLRQAGGFFSAVHLIRNDFYFSGMNYLRIFLAVGTFICAAQFAHILRHRVAGRYGALSIFFAGGLFLLNLAFSTFLGGKGFIAFPLVFFLLALYARKLYKNIGIVLMLFMAFISFVTVLQQIRVEAVHEQQSQSAWDYAYVGLRFRLFEDNLVYLGMNGNLFETHLGEDFINGALAPVPRSIWENKPAEITAGARFKRALLPNSSGGWPPYGFNQWYTNFGWLGVLIGGFITGLLLQSLQAVYKDYRSNTYSFVIMMVFLIRLLIPGGVDNLFLVEYIFFILPLFIFKILTDKRLYQIEKPVSVPVNE